MSDVGERLDEGVGGCGYVLKCGGVVMRGVGDGVRRHASGSVVAGLERGRRRVSMCSYLPS